MHVLGRQHQNVSVSSQFLLKDDFTTLPLDIFAVNDQRGRSSVLLYKKVFRCSLQSVHDWRLLDVDQLGQCVYSGRQNLHVTERVRSVLGTGQDESGSKE